jgi:hypothetical protein
MTFKDYAYYLLKKEGKPLRVEFIVNTGLNEGKWGRREMGGRREKKGEGRREKGEGRREKGEGRREEGGGRREEGEGRKMREGNPNKP